MRLLITLDGRRGELVLDRSGDGCRFTYQLETSERVERAASVLEVEPGIYSILVNGRSHEVKVVPGPEGYYVDLNGERSVVEVRDPRSASRSGSTGLGDGRQNITAPMPGKVVRVLVKEGDDVQAGAGLVVVEAMKMQNEVKAAKAGRVLFVKAKEGDTVAAGEVLAAIE
jgi:biotin carboxyl carrier protein